MGIWEGVLWRLGMLPEHPMQRWVFVLRALTLSTLLAGYTGWYVLAARRRLDRVRAALRERALALEAGARREEQTAGLGAITRVLAHEIRNPLNSMTLQCLLLRRAAGTLGGEGERAGRIAGLLEVEIRRLDRLVDSYLDEKGPVTLRREAVDLPAVCRTVLEVTRPAFEVRHAALRVTAPEVVPRVAADPGKMEQVVHNLVLNSLEAVSPGGKVELGFETDGRYLTMTLTDDGPGFDDPSKVFRPFYTTKKSGTGLGLAIVNDFVRAHGGTVVAGNLDPHEGSGARIVVRLPLEDHP